MSAADPALAAAGWFPAPGKAGLLLVLAADGLQVREAQLDAGAETWTVTAPGAQLELAPTSAQATVSGAGGPRDGFEQAVHGTGRIDDVEVAAQGRRGERADDGELGRADSLREVATWFDDGSVVAVTALRPRKAKGHDQDDVQAAVIDPEGAAPVVDPRVSTVSTVAGRARRVALELWSEDEEAPALRVAAEATGTGGQVSQAGWDLTLDWLVAHRRGRDGEGVYLLARPT